MTLLRFLLPISAVALIFAALPAFAWQEDAGLFDRPLDTVILELPGDQAGEFPTGVTLRCFYFPTFMVKEVDFHEKGAESHAVVNYTGAKPACERQTAGEKIVQEWWGYFLGVKGQYVFIDEPDGFSGVHGFGVIDAEGADGALLFDDGRGVFGSVSAGRDELILRYDRRLLLDCSLLSDMDCWSKLRAATGLTENPKDDCRDAYQDLRYPSPPDNPAVISYPVELRYAAGKVLIRPLLGKVSCWPQS